MEVACAWEPLILEREEDKGSKYGELSADLACQFPGWKIQVYSVVVQCR